MGKYIPQWSIEVPNTATPTSTAIHRSYDAELSPSLGASGCQTLYEVLRRGASINPMGPCLGFRATSRSGQATPFVYFSYTEIVARVDAIAAGLYDLNLVKKNEDGLLLLGLYMKNCMEWTIAEHAIYCLGGATCPFYDTLGHETVSFILNQTNLSACLCTRAELSKLVEAKKSGNCPYFKTVILVDGVLPESSDLCKSADLNVISLAKIETHGAHVLGTKFSSKDIHSPPSGLDIATFCYTSGTTGNPKGALLTHSNIMSAISGVQAFFTNLPTDRHLSYLPLPHVFERISQAGVLLSGASIGFFRNDPLLLVEDFQACRPTILPVAPRVLNKIYDKIMAGMDAAGGVKKALFDMALRAKTDGLRYGYMQHSIYDALIFNKIKKALGLDCVRVMVSGSAPLSENVMTFFRCLLGVPIHEGYGQTEGTAAATLSHPDDQCTVGHVGGPLPCVDIILVDVSEMGYLSTDTMHRGKPCKGRGEIWIRGPNVFKGYYKDEEKTKEALDENGWLHSGDIGLWNMEGALQIIDRKKNIFKLSQGEYVAAEKIENVIAQSIHVAQGFVYGDSLQSHLVAIIVPDEEPVKNWAKDCGDASLKGMDFKSLCQSEALKSFLLSEVKRVCKKNKLHGFEIPKAIFLESEQFSDANGLLTPTFKLKRKELRDAYQSEIDKMYSTSLPSSKL